MFFRIPIILSYEVPINKLNLSIFGTLVKKKKLLLAYYTRFTHFTERPFFSLYFTITSSRNISGEAILLYASRSVLLPLTWLAGCC